MTGEAQQIFPPSGSFILSRAHDWKGRALPYIPGRPRREEMVCFDCGHAVPVGNRDAVPCRRRLEAGTSGFGGIVILNGQAVGRFNRFGGPVSFRAFRNLEKHHD